MYLKDVITLLRTELPKNSDKYANKVVISTITYSGGTVTVTTSSAHGLATGDVCTIVDVKQKTPISSIVTTDGIATVTTSSAHDQTLDYESSEDQPQITIYGADVDDYNDSWDLASIVDRNTFTFEISGSPADATTGYLLENSVGGFSGIKTITRVSATQFTFTTDKTLASEGYGGYVHAEMRITGGISIDKCMEAYSKQIANSWWAFVVPTTVTASKDRQTLNDSTYTPTKGDEYRQKIISGFEVYIFVPSKTDIAGRQSYDEVVEESVYIFKALLGYALPNPYTVDDFSKIIFEAHGPEAFHNAYYIHRFSFSITDQLIIDDTNTTSEDVAFRDIDYIVTNDYDENIIEDSLETDEE